MASQSPVNKHGLSRYIPQHIKREVRQRSRFGCVICRRGFYQYEHIDPPFEEAKTHAPDRMCCLCGSCHDAVTRGQLSKALVLQKYRQISAMPKDVDPPSGPLDFHTGTAELSIGRLLYNPAVRSVLRYHGKDIIRVMPARKHGEPGKISAQFTDTDGTETLRLEENEWVGALEAWDIDVVGQRLTVRRQGGNKALELRLEPPGRIILAHLDMRIGDAHILVTEKTYAVGRYAVPAGFGGLPNVTAETVLWAHVGINIKRSHPDAIGINFTTRAILDRLDDYFVGTGQGLATKDRNMVMNTGSGVLVKHLGIAIGSGCEEMLITQVCAGVAQLDDVRSLLASRPDELCRFISIDAASRYK